MLAMVRNVMDTSENILINKRSVGRPEVVVCLVVDDFGLESQVSVGMVDFAMTVAVAVLVVLMVPVTVGEMLLPGCMVQSNSGLDMFSINQS
jgi:hypothetical protein